MINQYARDVSRKCPFWTGMEIFDQTLTKNNLLIIYN